jgi:hypothetical protein
VGVRKRRKVLIGVAVCVAGVMILFAWRSSKTEPRYEGRSLSEWLRSDQGEMWPEGADVSAATAEAIRNMAGDAAETALGGVRYEPSKFNVWLAGKTARLPRVLRPDFLLPSEYRGREAAVVFLALGSSAEYAVPALKRVVLENPGTLKEKCGIDCLLGIGPKALGALVDIAEKSDGPTGWYVMSMSLMHVSGDKALAAGVSNDPGVVPALARLAAKADSDLGISAVGLLGGIGDSAAVSAMAALLRSSNNAARVYAADRLGNLGPVARGAVPELKRAVEGGDGALAEAALGALKSIDPETFRDARLEGSR